MIQKKIAVILFFIAASACANAQNMEQNLLTWANKNPIEKVYLHLDRESYTAGQTMWFKGYFLSDYVPSSKSTALYLELLNEQLTIVVRKVFPAYMGQSIGQIDLPEDIVSGTYQLRAYSPLMLNQPGFVYSKKIFVFGKEPKQNKIATPLPATINLTFFPEGGNLISPLMNNIAFKATDENGLPVNISGEIKNNKDELVTRFSSQHDGMGSFAIVPLPGETYYAVIAMGSKKYMLPAATTRGVAFNLRNVANGKIFKIEQLGEDANFKAAYMIGQMQNNIVFKQNFPAEKNLLNGTIQTKDLLSGILHITIFNKDGMPLAERLTFVNNKEYILHGNLIIDTLNTGERKRNHFSIAMKDTVIGNFSVSVTDADYETTHSRLQNIYSYFLLNSDIKGYVHNPAWYFSSDADSVTKALELVMMTNGWTRFNWVDAAKNTLPKPLYKDPGFITLAGKIHIDGTRKPFAGKDLLYMMSPVDTSRGKRSFPRMMRTDSTGSFKLDSIIFYDKMQILFSDIRGNKSKFIKVKLDGDSLYRGYNIPFVPLPFKDSINAEALSKMTNAYNDYLKAEGLMLANVTVKGRMKSQQEQLDEKYSSGLFSGGINSRTLDLTKENATGLNIFEYLQGRIPSLRVNRDGQGSYKLSYREGGFDSGGNVSLYLDEMPTDASYIESIPVDQIAYVKLMPNHVGTIGGGTALAIYMKKGADLAAVTASAIDIVRYNGYAIVKEFYSPNYDVRKPEDSKADSRLTLLWHPSIYLAHINPKLPVVFYNNDRTKKFKIVVEGVTNDGRLLMIEKTVNP